METKGFRFEVITSGQRFLQIDSRMLRDFINSFIAENAFIMADKKFSLDQEKKFQMAKAKEIDSKSRLFVLCWKGKVLAGNAEARKGSFKESHNASFGLVVGKGYRGMGIGEKLLSMAMAQARKRLKAKCLWIDYIEGNGPARKLYGKMGFREVARMKGYVRHGGRYIDRIIMKYAE
ncbi:TPA: GNAT family N-acetyltransferase [Candidatus Micrarchaeota archaeon]|nr:GNAT family N-acetyltransferase [Candidatus Micrarchaeota archaeon]